MKYPPQAKKKLQRKISPTSPVTLRIALAQINTIVGDFQRNAQKIKSCLKTAKQHEADLILFPELTLAGYPPEDLLLRRDFLIKGWEALRGLTPHTEGITAVIGCAEPAKSGLFNSAALVSQGKLVGTYRKIQLPNYGVFDEKRYFQEGNAPVRFHLKGVTLGITICEDIWEPSGPGKKLCDEGGADVLLNISSSPYHMGKGGARKKMIASRARQYKAHVAYVNLVGGQDELVFDGHSLVMAPNGACLLEGNSFVEEMIFADLTIHPKSRKKAGSPKSVPGIKTLRAPRQKPSKKSRAAPPPHQHHPRKEVGEIYEALVLGTRDYVHKNGFEKALVGLSGGIDSSLTAAVGVDALGPGKIVGVTMPSPYSSKGSVDDSLELARNLKIETMNLPISKAMQAYDSILRKAFEGTRPGVAEENLQARIRGNLMMALSNKFGWIVLTTGNKSEFSVGYCTLYGDMAGGFAVIKDVTKTWVYRLAEWVNEREGEIVIPETVLEKEPSAELRPDQKDTDSLPPYSRLDPVLTRYVEEDRGLEDLFGLKLPRSEVNRVVRLVDANEYKRRQSPPGVKITPKAFGKDRRWPITNHFKGK